MRGRLLTCLAVLALSWVSAGCRGSAGGATGPRLVRVMTYNIHHGEGVEGRVDVARIAEVVRTCAPDLVALQEVDRGVRRTGRRDFPAELAQLLGMTCVFSNNFSFQGGEYGNAMLTRWPVDCWTNTHLGMIHTNEQRGLLQARVRVHGRPLVFMATHIDFRRDDAERLLQIGQFRQIAERWPGMPLIVAGDFNDMPGSRTHEAMKAWCDDAWEAGGRDEGFTIPSARPVRRIDYVWIRRGGGVKVREAYVPRTEASDHLPLVVDLELEGEPVPWSPRRQ